MPRRRRQVPHLLRLCVGGRRPVRTRRLPAASRAGVDRGGEPHRVPRLAAQPARWRRPLLSLGHVGRRWGGPPGAGDTLLGPGPGLGRGLRGRRAREHCGHAWRADALPGSIPPFATPLWAPMLSPPQWGSCHCRPAVAGACKPAATTFPSPTVLVCSAPPARAAVTRSPSCCCASATAASSLPGGAHFLRRRRPARGAPCTGACSGWSSAWLGTPAWRRRAIGSDGAGPSV